MSRNLPPGVSVSELPGNRPQPEPRCKECELILTAENSDPDIQNMCVDCFEEMGKSKKEYRREQREQARAASDYECEVCGKPLLRQEATVHEHGRRPSEEVVTCDHHDEDDFKEKHRAEAEMVEEMDDATLLRWQANEPEFEQQ